MVTVNQVTDRLAQLGHTVDESQTATVEFELNLILDYTVNYCNFESVDEIPTVVEKRLIDRVCAEYLYKQQRAGLLEDFNYEATVKTIKEGDTQLQFGTSNDGDTPESRFVDLCNRLDRGYDKWLTHFRRVKW